jgi:uncharacterized protein (TIGR02996 family)
VTSGDELLAELAERPFDRALRLVFADWLQEQGDPRGEVIALAARGELSLTQRRRVQRLTEQHAAAWLGPLVTVADVPACQWDGGFLDGFVAGAPPESAWRDVVGDRGLSSVRMLTFPLMREPQPVVPFLVHPVLRNVTRVQLGAELLEALGHTPVAFAPHTLALASWGTFGRELSVLGQLEVMKGARRLELITSEFINPIVAGEARSMVLTHARGVARFEELRLVARYGVVEGAAAWLLRGNDARRVETELPRARRWAVDYGDVGFTLDRASDADRFTSLTVNLSGGAEGATGLGQRVATASSVLVQLAPGALTRVDVTLPPGSGLRASEKDSLRAAVRRLGTVTDFHLGTTPALP